jgi:hypothetical protein
MKKFLVVLLSLGLLVAFGATASAADVKFSGSYYVTGLYEDNAQLVDTNKSTSRALFYQRIRVQPVFEIAPGLTFTTRFDAMEKQWGQTDWRGGFDDKASSRRETQSFGNPKIQESIEFERGYVAFATAAGVVQAGYMSSGKWGTDFGDDEQSRPRARIDTKIGPVQMGFVYEKEFEADTSSQVGYAGKTDADADTYAAYGLFNFKGGSAGVLYKFFDRRSSRPTAANNRSKFHALLPVVKVTFGPVYLEGEAVYMFGKAAQFDPMTPQPKDIDIDGRGLYLKARVNLGPAYFGVSGLYSQGNNLNDPTTSKTGPQSQDLDVGLILGNDALQTWTASSGNGTGNANGAPAFDSGKANSRMYSMFGGYNPTPQLNLEMTLLKGERDTDALSRNATTGVITKAVSKNMGIELDMTAKYKIYDNLTYMVGAGYLWTGDYFKGSNAANVVGNDYLLMNRLSLSF